ncbi:MAG: MFS transporter [Treponemataceae bacterium]|nr:MFS transporter [Treponemataceae bacterium]
MMYSTLTGCLATIWGIVCSPQPIFNVFFRNWLGASSSELGTLVAILQLTGIFQVLAIFIYGYSKRKKPFFIVAHLIHRFLTLSIALSAFIAIHPTNRSLGIRLIMVSLPISWFFMNISSAGWWSWVADLFPENIRGAFFLRRSAIINITNIVWFFLASMVLDLVPHDWVFIVYGGIFAIGAISGIVDLLLNIPIPEPLNPETPHFKAQQALEPFRNKDFLRFSFAAGLAIFSINLIGPFQAPFVVDPQGAQAPNTWLGVMYVISQLMWVVTAPFWGTVMDKWGRKPVVVLGCLHVLSWVGYFFLTPRSYFFLLPLISLLAGLLAPAFWEGINQMMLSLAPTQNRLSYVAWYMMIVGFISAGGSLVGGYLIDALAPFHFFFIGLHVQSFHVVQLLSILMVVFSAFIISRIRGSYDQGLDFVMERLVNPGIIKTYSYIETLSGTEDPSRTEEALRSIEAATGELALQEIIARLEDPYPEIREEAARALGRLRSPWAVPHLIQKLYDPSPYMRIIAARALGKIRDPQAVPALTEALEKSHSEEMKEACLQALGDIGTEEARKHITAYCQRDDVSEALRATAIEAASRLGNYEALEYIFHRLKEEPNPGLRAQYAMALSNLLGPNGKFYAYISGSSSAVARRIAQLFKRLDLQSHQKSLLYSGVSAKEKKKEIKKLYRAKIQSIQQQLESEQSLEALKGMLEISRYYVRQFIGSSRTEEEAYQLAQRVDPGLATFLYLIMATKKILGTGQTLSRESATLICLLLAYFIDNS